MPLFGEKISNFNEKGKIATKSEHEIKYIENSNVKAS